MSLSSFISCPHQRSFQSHNNSKNDIGLYLHGTILAQLNESLNKDPESLDHWLKGNKLLLNIIGIVSMNILSHQNTSDVK